MIGGLEGEFGDLDIKYLKQKISKCRSQISGSFRRNSVALCKMAVKFSQQKDNILTVVQNFPSTWSDRLPMAVTPSFQLRIVHRLKHWIVNFLNFETTYSMHKLSSRKCSKSGWHDCHQECFMLDFSLLPLLAFQICLWQRTLKLQYFGSSCFWAFHCFAIDSKELFSILDCFGDQKAIKTPKLNTIWLELIARVLNMLIVLKGDNYYSKVFKRVNYKL